MDDMRPARSTSFKAKKQVLSGRKGCGRSESMAKRERKRHGRHDKGVRRAFPLALRCEMKQEPWDSYLSAVARLQSGWTYHRETAYRCKSPPFPVPSATLQNALPPFSLAISLFKPSIHEHHFQYPH